MPWPDENDRAIEYVEVGLGIISAVGGAAPTTTWNPSDTDPHLSLSNGNLTVTYTAADAGGVCTRAVASANSGKKYWEVHVDNIGSAPSGTAHGFSNASFALNQFCGADLNSLGWAGDGKVYLNNAVNTTIQTWAANDTLCFALDMDNTKIWFRTNGGNWNNSASDNPATNTGGINYSSAGMNAGPYLATTEVHIQNDVYTADFGATTYAQTPPSGFGNW